MIPIFFDCFIIQTIADVCLAIFVNDFMLFASWLRFLVLFFGIKLQVFSCLRFNEKCDLENSVISKLVLFYLNHFD
jgi:hypothetical protein